jgi:Protein of unknown function (DUF1566)
MNRSPVTMMIVTVGCLLAGAKVSSAQDPYPLPAWDQKLPASTRFVPVLFQEFCAAICEQIAAGILDRETGLVWERIPSSSQRTFWLADSSCTHKLRGGRAGWRLPTVDELTSLVEQAPNSVGATLPPGHPFLNVGEAFYWTSSRLSFGGDSSRIWVVRVEPFSIGAFLRTATIPVWCVRGGQR